jgi:tetratricopeptide (TPR) repeat protein
MKLLINILVILFLNLLSLPISVYAENLIELPRTEGSKSFDMEINQLNNIGIEHYSLKELDKAEEKLKKATNLAQQLRDPSLGVISFNRALVLHYLHKNKEAIKYFTLAKKYARGDIRILNSQILKKYTK